MFFKNGATVKYDDGVLKIDIGEIYPSYINGFNFEIKLEKAIRKEQEKIKRYWY